ncbi:AraC family transcriptional regulator [Saccharicrinis sp. FJH2]|uniref:AraC family transcriptional regulator n=1 Tax=unclassified Saccharicrinis TaxID=2646859 RepID=UPI0035D4E1BB
MQETEQNRGTKNYKTSSPEIGKSENFTGDRSVVLSKKQLKKIRKNPLISGLYITDIGFYPNAKHHYRKRILGIKEHILIYCIDGYGTIKIGEAEHQLEPNTFFVIHSDTAHSYWASQKDPWSIYWLHFGGERSSFFTEHFSKVNWIKQSSKSRIDDRIIQFNELLTALESGFSKENINYANLSLNGLLASFFYVETYRAVKGFSVTNPVDQAIIFMQKNINTTIKIADISQHVKLSESHLNKIFRNKTGTSPMDYFINLKMQEAIRLLTNQSLKIKEVAYRLGYSDQYYFTRIFTKHIGSSPGSFSKMSIQP